jgi:hypothetical protein
VQRRTEERIPIRGFGADASRVVVAARYSDIPAEAVIPAARG